MGDLFWQPTRELFAMPGGWKMLRRGRKYHEGAIVEDEGVFRVYVREADRVVPVGSSRTLSEAAWLLWRAP